jgi:SAM-dependent methyltransferase
MRGSAGRRPEWTRHGLPAGGGEAWYRRVYQAVYAIGFTPWDRGVAAPDLVRLLSGPSAPAPGRALDLGCGTGRNCVLLAQRGWSVVGVDMVPAALARARRRAAAAGVSPTLVEGDVTRLDELDLGPSFSLLVDAGCLHTLPAARRDAYVAGVSAAAAPGALLLLSGFRNGRFAPMPAGVSPEEVRRRFRGWELEEAEPVTAEALRRDFGIAPALAGAVAWFDLWQYRLRRLEEPVHRN